MPSFFPSCQSPEERALRPIRARGDRFMAGICWVLCLVSACLAPAFDTWSVCLCIALPLAVIASLMAYCRPGDLITRLSIAAIFMTFAALLIHQLHGLIEMHFSVFVLLAFLLFYRDWRPVCIAAVVIAVHHYGFCQLQMSGYPIYVFPMSHGCNMVWVHAAFVVFESACLVYLGEIIRKEALDVGLIAALGERIAANGVIDLSLAASSGNAAVSPGLTRFLEVINVALSGASNVAERIGGVSLQMTEAALQMFQLGSTQNAAAIEVRDTVHRMSEATGSIADDCSQVAGVVESSSSILLTSRETMARTVTLMQTLGHSVGAVSQQIEDLHRDSERIENIIGVISDIADRTTLLGFNATIEAARAGEFGSGFNVVAKEVRDLASRTLASLADAQSVVNQVRARTAGARRAADRCREDATRGEQQVGEADMAMQSVVKQLPGIIARTSDVMRVAERHTMLAKEVVGRLDTIGQAIGTSSSDLSHFDDLNRALRDMAAALGDSVRQFRLAPSTST